MVQVLREGTWCAFVAAQEIGCSRRFGILVSLEREAQEQATPVLVKRERRHVMTRTMLVPTKFIHQLGHNRVALRCDTEPATEALARCIRTSCSRGDPDRSRDHVRASQSNGNIERAVGLVAGQASHLDQSPSQRKETVLANGIRSVFWDRKDTAAQTAWTTGHLGEDLVFARQASKRSEVGTAISSWSVCWTVELVRGSGRHRAKAGDQKNA